MKNVIKSLAVMGMILSILPANGIYTAKTAYAAEVSVTAAANAADIKEIAGEWRYQEANGNGTVDNGVIDTGSVYIAEDGTFTHTDMNGNITTGIVKTGIEEIGGTALRTVNFYNGDEYAFGGYYNDSKPGIISIGNGGIAQLARVEIPAKVEIKDIAGDWKYQEATGNGTVDKGAVDTGSVTIREDGTFTYTDNNGKVSNGTVRTGIEVIGGTALKTVGFYNGAAYAFGGYYDDNKPDIISIGNGGISQLARTAAPAAETAAAQVSRLAGDANLDGKVNVADAVSALQFVANNTKYPLTAQGEANADCDGVKGITGSDALYIQKIDAGIIW
ncbi:MAG: dockerin type I repeat-containing protein [Ruminococcus sp.]|nr:dockerin type I repeat-containing protein [Ruminococcus sp.]